MKQLAIALLLASALRAETVSWDPSPSGDQVAGYRLYWSTTLTAPMPWTVIATTAPTTVSAAGSTNRLTRNFYYITAFRADGSESEPSVIVWRPGAPQNPKVKP